MFTFYTAAQHFFEIRVSSVSLVGVNDQLKIVKTSEISDLIAFFTHKKFM